MSYYCSHLLLSCSSSRGPSLASYFNNERTHRPRCTARRTFVIIIITRFYDLTGGTARGSGAEILRLPPPASLAVGPRQNPSIFYQISTGGNPPPLPGSHSSSITPNFCISIASLVFTKKEQLGSAAIRPKIWRKRLVYQYEEQERMDLCPDEMCTKQKWKCDVQAVGPSSKRKKQGSRNGKLGYDVFVHDKAARSWSTLFIRLII